MEGLDLALSPAAIAAGFLVSTVGFGLFLYGKRATRAPQLVTGLALMGFPLFVHGAVATVAIGVGLVAALWAWVRLVA